MATKKQAPAGKPKAGPAEQKNPKASTSPGGDARPMNKKTNTVRLMPGELQEMVLKQHAADPTAHLSPTTVARKLGRHTGPVWLAQEALVKAGKLKKVSLKPQRYAVEGKSALPKQTAASKRAPSSAKAAGSTKAAPKAAAAAAARSARGAVARVPRKAAGR